MELSSYEYFGRVIVNNIRKSTIVDNSRALGVLLTNLSKDFDGLPHRLLIAKLNEYGFRLKALRLMNN